MFFTFSQGTTPLSAGHLDESGEDRPFGARPVLLNYHSTYRGERTSADLQTLLDHQSKHPRPAPPLPLLRLICTIPDMLSELPSAEPHRIFLEHRSLGLLGVEKGDDDTLLRAALWGEVLGRLGLMRFFLQATIPALRPPSIMPNPFFEGPKRTKWNTFP